MAVTAEKKVFSIRDQLVAYGAYHAHPVNIVIHRICVPLIIWSFAVILCYNMAPQYTYRFNNWMQFDANISLFYAIPVLLYYYTMDPVAALLITPQWFFMYHTGCSLAHRPNSMTYAIIVNVVCWILQFVGHGVFEGRSPALLDNVLQAFVFAPFFVHLENLFALGYRNDLFRSVQEGVSEKRAEFERQKVLHGRANSKAKAF